MIYAQIKDGVVLNTIVLEDTSLESVFSAGFDYFISIDAVNPKPSIGWGYDGSAFSPIVPPVITTQSKYESIVEKAIAGFNNIMIEYAASNIILGITQAGKTKLIADTLADIQRYGMSGSLYQVIAGLQSITLTSDMDPYLNSSVIADLIQKTKDILNSL
jgi:hypothetical protein